MEADRPSTYSIDAGLHDGRAVVIVCADPDDHSNCLAVGMDADAAMGLATRLAQAAAASKHIQASMN